MKVIQIYILFLSSVLMALPAISLHLTQIDLSLYKTEAEYEREIDWLIKEFPDRLQKKHCTKSNQTYNFLQINAVNDRKSNKKPLNAMITCGVHARELLTSQVCLRFIRELAQRQTKPTQFISSHANFRIFYISNQMRDSVIKGEYCRRTDSNDVDLNRNFPTGYVEQKPGLQTNPGPYPLSEPFSQCIQQQVTRLPPDIFLDVHTGQFTLFYTLLDSQSEANHKREVSVLRSIQKKICVNCRLRTSDTAQGEIYQDLKIRHKIKWSNLVQIYGGYNQNLDNLSNCWTIFNPKNKEIFDYYQRRSKNILIEYFYKIIKIEVSSKK